MTTTINLCDGKYTVTHDNGENLRALRNGEPWRDLFGDGLVLAMAQRIEELESACEANGEFIADLVEKARACNAHDDLVAALQRSRKWIEGQMEEKGWSTERVKNPPEGSHLHAINAALAKAGAA